MSRLKKKIQLIKMLQQYLIKSEQTESGSTLVLSVMLGLLLISATTMALSSAMNANKNSISNNYQKQSTALSETAITRFQDLINKNSEIATYPDCATTRDSNNFCQDSTTDNSWFRAENIVSSNNFCNTTSTEAKIISNTATNQKWFNVNSLDPTQGQYRLISYNYGPNVGITPGTGRLVIEARTSPNNNTSTSRIEVSIPVVNGSKSNVNLGTTGLWISSNPLSDISGGSSEIRSEIQDSTCSVDYDTKRIDKLKSYQQYPQMKNGNSYNYNLTEGEPFPSLPLAGQNPPTGIGVNTLTQINSSTVSLPKVSHTEVNNTFTYNITDITKSIVLNSGQNLTINAGTGKTVVLYLNGDMSIAKDASLIVTGGTKLIIYTHSNVNIQGSKSINPLQNNSGTADFIQLYQYNSGSSISFSGALNVKAFIFAPYSLVNLAGGTVFSGTIWSNIWKASGDSIFTQGDTNLANIIPLLSPTIASKPMITGISAWEKQTVPSSITTK